MGKVTIPTTGDGSGQWQAPFSTRHGGKWCCGQWLPAVDFLAENFAAKFASSNEPLQLGFLFSVCAPVCHSTIILGDVLKMDTVSNFLSLITVREIGVREAEKGRNPKPQKRRKTFLNSISKMRKSNSPSHSTQPSTHPIWSPTLGRLRRKRHFGEVRRVSSAFTASRIFSQRA